MSDPSRVSHYVTDALYRDLVAWFSDWQRDALAIGDPLVRDEFRALLEREARLLDQAQYEDWLALFAPECIHWAPARPHGSDPRREVAVIFDDRRRMEDRIYRLRTGHAWSQVPASRTVRLVSNVEVFATMEDAVRMARSNFLLQELQGNEARLLSGWCGYRFVFRQGRWQIAVKQINLLGCDQPIRNPSMLL